MISLQFMLFSICCTPVVATAVKNKNGFPTHIRKNLVDDAARSTSLSRIVRSTQSAPKGPQYFFSFGDSYTTTYFNVKGTLPSASNPIGNPAFSSPTFNGGKNWVEFLTGTYNNSLLLTYNFGVAGATVDRTIVSGATVDFVGQAKLFNDSVSTHPSTTPWKSENSIFGFWFGINDVNNGYTKGNTSAVYEDDISKYFKLADDLYRTGARRIFFLEAPPLQRFPALLGKKKSDRDLEISVKESFNRLLQHHHDLFKSAHRDIISYLINVDSAFDLVLDNPQKFGAPNATCSNTDGSSCLWRDGLHAGVQIHNQVALKIASTLEPQFFHIA